MSWLVCAQAAATGLVLSLLFGPTAPVQSGAAQEVEACLRTCNAQDDETDRATCRLNCERAAQAKDEPNVIRWRRTEEIRGGFDGEPTRREVEKTTTTTTPRGTPQSTTSASPSPVTSPPTESPPTTARPRSRYDALAGCQSKCDVLTADGPRATCKLQCLHDPWGEHAPSPVAANPVPAQAPRVTRPAEASAPKSTSKPTETAETSATDRAACRRACTDRADRCRNACSGQGSDRSTCELQCDQVASRCLDRCG
jgi:hypothetical protein